MIRTTEQHQQPASAKTYLLVYGALMALLLLTAGAAYIDLGPFNVAVALGIALAKAALVVLFFMHALRSPRLIWAAIGAAVFWLAIMFGLTLSDYLTRGWSFEPVFGTKTTAQK